MSKKEIVKTTLKVQKINLIKEINSLKKSMREYKSERKANWLSFKTQMNTDIEKLKKLSK